MTQTHTRPLQAHQRAWISALDRYEQRYPQEIDSIGLFRTFMLARPDAAERSRTQGHLTGSAWLVSADGARTLLTHHRKLDRWLQPGGHADGDVELARVALREAEEETGLSDLMVEPAIFDLDRHKITARGNEPAHWHYDVRYVVCAQGSEDFTISAESHALAWRDIVELVDDSTADESLRRMASKWLMRDAIHRAYS
jgi:8-oxo-dGTP pyrophosphatase MutT (NUDIX family)